LRAYAALCLLALAGCNSMDPLTRPYVWKPTDINAHNIAAMAANPADLRRGRDKAKRQVGLESDAVDRLGPATRCRARGGASGGSSGGGAVVAVVADHPVEEAEPCRPKTDASTSPLSFHLLTRLASATTDRR